jgi:hypothetical protein
MVAKNKFTKVWFDSIGYASNFQPFSASNLPLSVYHNESDFLLCLFKLTPPAICKLETIITNEQNFTGIL